MGGIEEAVALILERRREAPATRALLVAVSGIDGSGKGYVSVRLGSLLEQLGARVACVNIDGWLRLPSERFDSTRPGEHFYERGIRLEEMFDQLILPLKRDRGCNLEVQLTDATNSEEYKTVRYQLSNIDIIVLEGVFLFKKEYCRWYDVKLWVDCTFETALERALARGQEGLSPEDTIRDYQTTYFAAQRLHSAQDAPRSHADLVIHNDPRLPLLRPYREKDQDAVISLWRACDLVRPWNDPIKDIQRKLRVRPDLFLVGLLEDRLVASVMVGYEGHRGWINYLAVAPDCQRQGFGRLLMAEAERLLMREGCPKINLQVRVGNTGVIAFYRSLGFAIDEVVSLGKRLESDEALTQ